MIFRRETGRYNYRLPWPRMENNGSGHPARTSATLARTEALRNECRRLRLQSVHRQRESVELIIACQKAGQACRSSIERCKVRNQPLKMSESGPTDLGLASVIVHALSGVGIKAFLLEPSRDTALIT